MPSKVMVPLSASSSRSRTRPRVDLPQPDSPTSPSTSPARMSRSTPSTARTEPLVRPNDPDFTGNVFTTPLASTSTLPSRAVAGPVGGGSLTVLLLAAQRDLHRCGDGVGVQEAANLVPRRQLDERRQLLGALREVVLDAGLASWRETASRGKVDQVRHPPGDHRQLLGPPPDHGHRPDQSLGVRVQRRLEQCRGIGLLDDLPGVHHRDPLAHLGHHAEIVGDEHDGHAEVGLGLAHEVEDLGLDRDVERGGGLVRDQQLRRRRRGPWRSSPVGPVHPTTGVGSSSPAARHRGCGPS